MVLEKYLELWAQILRGTQSGYETFKSGVFLSKTNFWWTLGVDHQLNFQPPFKYLNFIENTIEMVLYYKVAVFVSVGIWVVYRALFTHEMIWNSTVMLCSRFRDDFTIISTDFGPTQSWGETAGRGAFKAPPPRRLGGNLKNGTKWSNLLFSPQKWHGNMSEILL